MQKFLCFQANNFNKEVAYLARTPLRRKWNSARNLTAAITKCARVIRHRKAGGNHRFSLPRLALFCVA